MSLDVYLQDFADVPVDRGPQVLSLLGELLDDQRQSILTADGSTAVYGLDDTPLTHLSFAHVAGEPAWDLIFDVAKAANWVVMPVGCPICLPDERLIETIPPELRDLGYVHVTSGQDILRAVRSS